MNRRDLIVGLPTLLTYACGCGSYAAARNPYGCRTLGGGATEEAVQLQTADEAGPIAAKFAEMSTELKARFAIEPALYFYDDGNRPNAKALQAGDIASGGPDGTVLVGINLIRRVAQRVTDTNRYNIIREAAKALGRVQDIAVAKIIMAHEFGHIVQYKHGMKPTGPWEMEPHADFLAGWCLRGFARNIGSAGHEEANDIDISYAAKFAFGLGDTDFDDDHHGEPQLRQAMVRTGFELGELDLETAFRKGINIAFQER